MKTIQISVIVCTFNRCDVLREALESIAASRLPLSTKWEVLIVDNNSNDRTRQVVADFERRHPSRFRYVLEQQPGKSYALNTGVREAQGDILAFTDDDVTVEPDWLHNLTCNLGGGKWRGAGGRTLASEKISPPSWLALDGPYGLEFVLAATFDLGPECCQLRQAPYGANMAFRKEAFEKYGYFRTDLGPSPDPTIPRPNEDTEFGRRLMAGGERLLYEPLAVAFHPVPRERIRKEFLLAWHFDFGRAVIREWGQRPDIWGIPRPCLSLIKAIAVHAPMRILRWLLAWNPPKRFYLKCWVWRSGGEIVELWRLLFSKALPQATKSTTGVCFRGSKLLP